LPPVQLVEVEEPSVTIDHDPAVAGAVEIRNWLPAPEYSEKHTSAAEQETGGCPPVVLKTRFQLDPIVGVADANRESLMLTHSDGDAHESDTGTL
jgi:hypothetical protein